MTGYVGARFAESFGIIMDYVDPELTELIKVQGHCSGYYISCCIRDFYVGASFANCVLCFLVYIKVYAREYGDIPIRETKCGYACMCSFIVLTCKASIISKY